MPTKRPDTVETVVLAMELLRRIPRGRKVTASELHQQLKDTGIFRDLRTIQRQLDLLSSHFEIERDDRNKPYGYRWLEQARPIAVPSLTPQESLLFLLAEEYLKGLLPARLMKSMEGFFTQARRNLSADGTPTLDKQWPSKVRVVATSQPLLPPPIDPEILATVSEALYSNRLLAVEYENSGGKRTSADVMPLGLAQQGPRLYLVCRYLGYTDERSLALHRIQLARISSRSFKRPKDFDLSKYDNAGRFRFGEGKKIRLTFVVDKERGRHLMETPLSEDQTVAMVDRDHLRVSATVVDSAMLDWWLNGFGREVTGVHKEVVSENIG